jgi:CheY-like chemotaxis protein
MRRVVFVDDEETLVWSLLKQGQMTRPDFVFDGFSDPVLAREAIQSNPPDVLVTDLRMPGLTGLDLLVAGRQASAQLPVIIVSAYGTPEVREEIKRQAGVQFIEKPATFQRLMEAVERAITPRTGFSGAIDLPLLPDLIQIYAIGQTTGMLRIHRGGERGEIYFDSGCITHATCGDAEGEAAFYRIMTWDGGAFSMENGTRATTRTIQSSWQELLLEGCRLSDEAQARETTGALPPTLEGSARALWDGVQAEVKRLAPEASVFLSPLGSPQAQVLQGGLQAHGWSDALTGIESLAARLAGAASHGSVEWVGPEAAAFAAWDADTGLLLLIVESLSGQSAAGRFRSNVSRWRGASRPWLR